MYLYSLYNNYAQRNKYLPVARYNNLALFRDMTSRYIILDLSNLEVLHVHNGNLSEAEELLEQYLAVEPMVLMADLEFCDLEYNDSILTNSTSFICEALESGRYIKIVPKETK